MQDLVVHDDPRTPVISSGTVPSPAREIPAGGDDGITRDYMDYGKFEQPPSPATEAVKKVKQRIIARDAGDKSRHLLEWVE